DERAAAVVGSRGVSDLNYVAASGIADVQAVQVGGGNAEDQLRRLGQAGGDGRRGAGIAQVAVSGGDVKADDGTAGSGGLTAVEADVQVAVRAEAQSGRGELGIAIGRGDGAQNRRVNEGGEGLGAEVEADDGVVVLATEVDVTVGADRQ